MASPHQGMSWRDLIKQPAWAPVRAGVAVVHGGVTGVRRGRRSRRRRCRPCTLRRHYARHESGRHGP